MSPLRAILVAVLLAFVLPVAPAQAETRVVAYVPNWVDLKTFSTTIDYDKITHINIAFENPSNDEGDLSFDKKDELLIAKAREKKVKILVSIGGGSAADDKKIKARYTLLTSDAKREAFVAKLLEYVTAHDFDGLDVDIEGPSIGKDYGPFIAALTTAFHAKGKLVTAALSRDFGGKNVPDAALKQFDFVNIMAYDNTGPWDPKSPGQHSSLDYAKASLKYWIDRGLPKANAVLGVPFYGYGFGTAFKNDEYSYKSIVAKDPAAASTDQTGNTIYYNGIPTIKAKSQYVLDHELGGIMIWSLDSDAKGDKSLLNAIHETLHPAPATQPTPATAPSGK